MTGPRKLVESVNGRTAARSYSIDGRRVSNHDYSLAWLALRNAGRLPEQGRHETRPGGWRTVWEPITES